MSRAYKKASGHVQTYTEEEWEANLAYERERYATYGRESGANARAQAKQTERRRAKRMAERFANIDALEKDE